MVVDRTRQHHAVVALIVLAAVLLGGSTLVAAGGGVSAAERAVFRAVNDGPGWLAAPAWTVMQLGNGLAPVALAGVALACRRLRLAIALGAAGGAAYFAAIAAKAAVNRPRPAALLTHVHLRVGSVATGQGFPSGHTAVAAALATVACCFLAPRRWWVFAGIAGLVGIARVFVGAHLPLDVVGGAALGLIIGIAIVVPATAAGWPDPATLPTKR